MSVFWIQSKDSEVLVRHGFKSIGNRHLFEKIRFLGFIQGKGHSFGHLLYIPNGNKSSVSAALEGTIMTIPSIAVSLAVENSAEPCFDTAAEVAVRMVSYVLEHSLPYDTLLNVNVPNINIAEIKGIRFTRQGKRIYEGSIQETFDPWGEKYYWIGGGTPRWEHAEDTDITAVMEGYVSITPLHPDLTNYKAIDFLRQKPGPWNTKS